MEDDAEGREEEPLDEEERELLEQDLVDVQVLKELLGPRGIKGTEFYCPDCEEDHYLTWDLLAGNLQEILQAGESPVHEPAFEPNPDEYVKWDYARGFLDGYESFEQEELIDVSHRIVAELRERGWRNDEVKGLLASAGLEWPSGDAG
ncbi:MAG TPA: DUF5319 family protein [Actinomycetota bacterium]|jgi:hypothetical protein|nr:DUF5319 family protein [Actinomycetota bacterium]